ncbi:hypothetical protein WQQ_23460 [Hydrocarboniphaga effusa AP103]|uniref:Uncharacterized protein n=1 Tax=Hydrocarboniphaga effusa AP103 TaxID=1172194 RepID=I7ZJU4_9GAMM|nr:hypothetical protein WQQ_23460 [Hydrocarboniphaga effusa AP103]
MVHRQPRTSSDHRDSVAVQHFATTAWPPSTWHVRAATE